MVALYIILLIIGLLAVLLLVAAAFAGDEYIVERNIIINRPVAAVFHYVKYLKNQANYNKMGNDRPKREQGI